MSNTVEEMSVGKLWINGEGNINAMTVSADGMTADPETATEAGYITITINGTDYQIPIYAA